MARFDVPFSHDVEMYANVVSLLMHVENNLCAEIAYTGAFQDPGALMGQSLDGVVPSTDARSSSEKMVTGVC